MAYDLKRSHFSIVLEREVSPGETINEEGVCLIAVLDPATGTEKVEESNGDGNDVVAGFAIRDNADSATTSAVEEVTIPTSPNPLTVTLSNNNIVASTPGDGSTADMRVEAPVGTALTLVDGAVAADGQVAVEPATGILNYHADESGVASRITYRYNLTVAESRLLFYQRNINNEASTLFGQVGVGHGHGEVYTDQFDATLAWDAGTAITSGAAGQLTQGGSGQTLDARVISVPNVNNPLLGIAFDLGGSGGA